MDVSTSTVKDQKLWLLSSRPNNFHLSTNSLTKPHQRSSVVIWNNTISFSLPNLPLTTIPSTLPTPKPPKHSKANFFSSWSIAMLKITNVLWNSSESLKKTAQTWESSIWKRTWLNTPQNQLIWPLPVSLVSSTVSSMELSRDIWNQKKSQITLIMLSRLLSERTSMNSSWTQPRMFSLNSMPHGADTANPWPQSGKNSEKNTR